MIQRYTPYIPPALPGDERVAVMIPDSRGGWVKATDADTLARQTVRKFSAKLVLRARELPHLIARDSFIAWLKEAL